ncbi:GNAT family N-acetyltransferase [Paenibacillus mucilaginosus]|uniref:GNAT family N-acetyltransferase n=1 Tax=Paenibacillus mucilaginosus TaxID=61624 RepID=UPI0009DAC428|nr:GNAT family protein [Paenibacillus mucilaginosus]MCG7218169.1 GNAT family N-acetyltransferase [Paenibacillus mucilaginosus]WDM29685.1 GNAT family N-acetyltransferase [Paenibacillus mucilaginosus]
MMAVIKLEHFERSDFAQLMEWMDSPKFLFQWGGQTFSFPLNEQQLEHYIKDANTNTAQAFIYRVVHEENNEVIGHIHLQMDRVNQSARIGKVLVGKRSLRGQGIGQLMIKKVAAIAFEELKLHRVSLGVLDFNLSAIACYEKAGFVKEGLIRDKRRMDNEFWSVWEMSMLENEWLK